MRLVRNKAGFTVVELMTALAIGSILTGITFRELGPVRDASAARSARESYSSLYARARAISIQHGERVFVVTDPVGDSAWIQRGTEQVEVVHFATEYAVDLRTPTTHVICMTPRGFADPDCGNVDNVTNVTFEKHGHSQAVRVMPFGQVEPVTSAEPVS